MTEQQKDDNFQGWCPFINRPNKDNEWKGWACTKNNNQCALFHKGLKQCVFQAIAYNVYKIQTEYTKK